MSDLVPEGWEKSTLGQVAKLTMGQSPSSDTYNTEGEGLPFYQGKTDFGSRTPKVRYWCKAPTKIAEENSILFSVRAPVGEVNLTLQSCCIGRGLAGILAETSDQEFLYQKLQYVKPRFQLLSQGSTFEAINGSELKELDLLLPPLPEQQKIATILSSVDKVIETTRAQIDKLKDLKTGMMQELLTKGIGVDGKPHTVFKDSPVGRVPMEWEVVTLSDIVETKGIQTGPFGSQLHAHEYIEWGVPVVMPKDMKSNSISTTSIAYISEERAESLKKHRIKSGDILFARRGEIGRFALVAEGNEGWVCGTGCLRVKVKRNINPVFISSYLTRKPVIEWLNSNAVGQTMLNLNTSILGDLPIVLPSPREQLVIGQSIVALDSHIKYIGMYLEKSILLKKALMQDLLTGKVRVKIDEKEKEPAVA